MQSSRCMVGRLSSELRSRHPYAASEAVRRFDDPRRMPPLLFGFLIDRVGTGALAVSAGLGLASTAALLCCACHTSGGCQHRASPALSICACSAAGLVGWALRGLVMSVPSTLSRDPQHHYCKPGYIINNHGTPKSLLSADLTVPKWRFATPARAASGGRDRRHAPLPRQGPR